VTERQPYQLCLKSLLIRDSVHFWCNYSQSGGQDGPPPPLIKSRSWSWMWEAVCLGHGDELSLKSLTFSPSFVWKWTILSASGSAPWPIICSLSMLANCHGFPFGKPRSAPAPRDSPDENHTTKINRNTITQNNLVDAIKTYALCFVCFLYCLVVGHTHITKFCK